MQDKLFLMYIFKKHTYTNTYCTLTYKYAHKNYFKIVQEYILDL